MCQVTLSRRLRGRLLGFLQPLKKKKSQFLSVTRGGKSALNVLHPLQERAVRIYGILFSCRCLQKWKLRTESSWCWNGTRVNLHLMHPVQVVMGNVLCNLFTLASVSRRKAPQFGSGFFFFFFCGCFFFFFRAGLHKSGDNMPPRGGNTVNRFINDKTVRICSWTRAQKRLPLRCWVSEHAEITFNQGEEQKSMRHHEVTQTHLANAGTWFEESLSFRSLQGEKVRRKLWKWWQMNDLIKTSIQEQRGGWGGAGEEAVCEPTKWRIETIDSSLWLISQERPRNQSGQWPMWPPRVCLIDPFIQRQLLSALSVAVDAISGGGSNEAGAVFTQLHSCCKANVAVCVNMSRHKSE